MKQLTKEQADHLAELINSLEVSKAMYEGFAKGQPKANEESYARWSERWAKDVVALADLGVVLPSYKIALSELAS